MDIFGGVFGKNKKQSVVTLSQPPPVPVTMAAPYAMAAEPMPMPTWNHYAQANNANPKPVSYERTLSTPLDNIPFTARPESLSGSNGQVADLTRYFRVVDRIGLFLSTPSQSDYNFRLENSIIRESQSY